MNIQESFRTAMESLRANGMRSLLTMLGIIIGIGAVIGLLSLGEGFGNLVEGEINEVGTNLIFVASDDENGYQTLTLADMEALQNSAESPAIAAVSGSVQVAEEVIGRSESKITAVSGVSGNHFALNNIDDVASGQLFDTADDNGYASVAVLGSTIAADLFDGNPIGQDVTIDGANFSVVAVLAPSDDGLTGSNDEAVFVPLSTALQRFEINETRFGDPALSRITVQATDEGQVDAAMAQISDVLREEHDLVYGAADDFALTSLAGLAESFSTITDTLTLFVGAIAGISLLVGGIGIMNIMLVSVTERTREIGIRKAIGALRRDVLLQFLLESLILTLIGGAIGVVVGFIVAQIGGAYLSVATSITLGSIGLAVGFSAAVGILFGIYPAWQAATLRPIEALRFE